MSTEQHPITLKELLERGTDDDIQALIGEIFGEFIPAIPGSKTDNQFMMSLGFGPVCDCGERGLTREEVKLGHCLECVDAQYEAAMENLSYLDKPLDGTDVFTDIPVKKQFENITEETNNDVGC